MRLKKLKDWILTRNKIIPKHLLTFNNDSKSSENNMSFKPNFSEKSFTIHNADSVRLK